MRRRVSGMDEVDNALLEFYHLLGMPGEEPVWMKPGNVFRNLVVKRDIIDKGHATVVRHMQKLAKAGLLQTGSDDDGYYAITDLGIRYVEDDLTEDERENLEDRLN